MDKVIFSYLNNTGIQEVEKVLLANITTLLKRYRDDTGCAFGCYLDMDRGQVDGEILCSDSGENFVSHGFGSITVNKAD